MTPIAAAYAVLDYLERDAPVPTDLLSVLAPVVGDSSRWFTRQRSGYRCCTNRERIETIVRVRLLIVRLEQAA